MAITTLDRAVVRAEPWQVDESALLPLPVWVERTRSARSPCGDRLAEVIPLRPYRPAVANSPVRLTRRGRLTLSIAAVACALAVAGLAASSAGAAPGGAAPPTGAAWSAGAASSGGAALSKRASGAAASVVVAPGDTVWEIAVRADPRADPRVTVGRIGELNHLSGGQIRPGQRLLLPSR